MEPNPNPVFFVSLAGVDRCGYVDEHEYIFDLYTKLYDFQGTNVKVISAQDLWDFYESKHKPVSTSVEFEQNIRHKRRTFRDFFTFKKKLKERKDVNQQIKDRVESPDENEIDVYKMAEFFIDEHSDGHFVVDECPFKGQRKSNYNKSMLRNGKLLILISHIWFNLSFFFHFQY